MPFCIQECVFGYRKVPVFQRLSAQIPMGTTVLLGPNGAGKSTLLGLLASRFVPAEGEISYRGLNPTRKRDRAEYRAAIGWMPQQIEVVPGLTVREQVSYSGWLKGLSRSEAWTRAQRAVALVDLADLADRRTSQLSGGQLRRVGLAQALVHDAEVILMDEPTAGLDPQQRDTFRGVLGRVAERSHVIVSTHQTEDITDLYQSVIVLAEGRFRFEGPTKQFLQAGGGRVAAAYAAFVSRER